MRKGKTNVFLRRFDLFSIYSQPWEATCKALRSYQPSSHKMHHKMFRLVGLLLVARALPAGKDDVVRKVLEAVTPSFLVRLLLPLSNKSVRERLILDNLKKQKQQQEEEVVMRQIGMVTLGLAVIASMVRVPEVAQREEIISMLPSYLAVIEAGGVKRAILGENAAVGTNEIEIEAINDAVECVWGVVMSNREVKDTKGKNGGAYALECGGLEALLQGIDFLVQCRKIQSQDVDTRVPLFFDAILLMVRLVHELGQQTKSSSSKGQGLVYRTISHVFALPFTLQSMGIDAKPSIACHLEALNVLQTVMMNTEDKEASVQVQHGIKFLLQGRTSIEAKHGALILAARSIDALGCEWWSLEGNKPMSPFFQLLVEVARIETVVLLRDCVFDDDDINAEDSGQACNSMSMLTLTNGKNMKQSEALQRAVNILPCCFAILESAVDLLIENENYDQDDTSDAIATRALRSITEATESVLSLLESVEYNSNQDIHVQDIAAGAVRLLGRFTAEMPLDIFQSRILNALPRLLSISSSGMNSAGNDGLIFLLPLLIRATDVSERNEAWIKALAQPAVLQILVKSIQSMTIDTVDTDDASKRVIAALCDLMLQLGCQLERMGIPNASFELFMASCHPLSTALCSRTELTSNNHVMCFLQYINVKSQS